MSIFSKLFNGLKKTKFALTEKCDGLFGNAKIDDCFYEELEYVLLSSDIGVGTVNKIIYNLKGLVKKTKIKTTNDCKPLIKKILIELLENNKPDELNFPLVIMVIGVNGVGKTTTVGKLAKEYSENGKKVIISAADTFRAAASDQLSVWAQRANVSIVKSTEGADPASVVFDAISSFKAKNGDVLIIDTAGRLHNKASLMFELQKISRVVDKELPNVLYRKFIVLDATTGQNAIEQVKMFDQAVNLTDIVVTKLDGTSKGGVVFAIIDEFAIPVRYVGVGENVDDLLNFDPENFVNSIL